MPRSGKARLVSCGAVVGVLAAVAAAQATQPPVGGDGGVHFTDITPRSHISYRSNNNFGLGSETAIKSLEIRWPSGRVQQFADVPVDRVLRVEEPH